MRFTLRQAEQQARSYRNVYGGTWEVWTEEGGGIAVIRQQQDSPPNYRGLTLAYTTSECSRRMNGGE